MGFKRAKIIDCKPESNYRLWIKFDDGLNGEVDLSDLAGKGVFKEAWRTQQMFNQVEINSETGTVTWGFDEDAVDLDPYVLREKLAPSK